MTAATHHEESGRYSRMLIDRTGLWLFLLSESMLFVGLLAGRFYLQGTNRPAELSQVLGLVITSILLLSSLTMYRAEVAITHGDRSAFLSNTLLTLVLGLVFVGGVAYEWSQAFMHFPPNTAFGTVFFSMTGMHALHVLSGLILLALLYWNGRRGRFGAEDHWTPEAVAKYWHMVDVVWVFFYAALYLV
ncbi:MAG: cytochrome c oxidase subunit 3 [Anaerolineae bacterium]|nr:cytochrome c oxidase subunit 3 [Anaerolineae bacterium]